MCVCAHAYFTPDVLMRESAIVHRTYTYIFTVFYILNICARADICSSGWTMRACARTHTSTQNTQKHVYTCINSINLMQNARTQHAQCTQTLHFL